MNEQIEFYRKEKTRFDELLNQLNWTEDHLLQEQETLIQCPVNREHRCPIQSKHIQMCQLVNEGFSKEYLKELMEYKQEKQLLDAFDISLTPSILSNILHRSLPIKTDIPLNVEQTTVLLTPNERLTVAQFVQSEASRLKIVPKVPLPIIENLSSQSSESNLTQSLNKLTELRDQKRRRTKYDAREMIATQMELLDQNQIQNKTELKRSSKHKHRSSSKKKHHRHSKKQRTS
ncbi:hypothetical protein I4U23_010196 [Adineta vaga]|nr:hypothetical protein I4U23_010196 [Adineta vaga]